MQEKDGQFYSAFWITAKEASLKTILPEYMKLSYNTFRIPDAIKSGTDTSVPEETENASGKYYAGEKPSARLC